MSRIKLLLSESLRSMGANLSTSVAATMTVLIGMFLLGLFVALGSWVVSWSDHVKSQLEVRVILAEEAAPKQVNVLRAYLDGDSRIKHYTFVSKADALRIQTKSRRSSPKPAVQPSSRRRTTSRRDGPRTFTRSPPTCVRRSSRRSTRSSTARRRRSGFSRSRERSRSSSCRRHHPPDRFRAPDREHDPPLDLLAAA